MAAKPPPPKEEKKSWFSRLFSSDKDKNAASGVPQPLLDGEMSFDMGAEEEAKAPIVIEIKADVRPVSKRVDPKKGHPNLCQVYHDESYEQQ